MTEFNPCPFDTHAMGCDEGSLGALEWCMHCGQKATMWFDGSAWGGGILARCDVHARQVRSENCFALTRKEVSIILVMGS